MMRIAVWSLSAALLLAGPGVALAQDSPEAQLAGVRELVLHANYRAALPAARALLERTDLDAVQRNAALETLAVVHLALRDEAQARQALAQLYARDPGHRLTDPDASPVVQSAFARARESASPLSVVVEHEPPVLERRGAPTIAAHVGENADAVHEVRLAYRQRGDARANTIVLPLDDGARAQGRIPLASDDAAYVIEYWLEAVAPSDHVLARVGSPSEPLVIEVPAAVAVAAIVAPEVDDEEPASGGDVTSEAWFWVVLAVLVAGAGAGVAAGVVVGSEGPEDGSLGNVTLPLIVF